MDINFYNQSQNQCPSISNLLKGVSGFRGYEDRVSFSGNSINYEPIGARDQALDISFTDDAQNLAYLTLSSGYVLGMEYQSLNQGTIEIVDINSLIHVTHNNGTVINNTGSFRESYPNENAGGRYVSYNYGDVYNLRVLDNHGNIYSDDKDYKVYNNHSDGYVYGSMMFESNSGTIEKGYVTGSSSNCGEILTAYVPYSIEGTWSGDTGVIHVTANAETGVEWPSNVTKIYNHDLYDGHETTVLYLSGSNMTFESAEASQSIVYTNRNLTAFLNGPILYDGTGGLLYIANMGVVCKYTGVSPTFQYAYYVDGVLSNLDGSGNNAFRSDETMVNGAIAAAGSYDTWNNKFYQGGQPYTGDMTYTTYETNNYSVRVPNGTATISFVNGIAV